MLRVSVLYTIADKILGLTRPNILIKFPVPEFPPLYVGSVDLRQVLSIKHHKEGNDNDETNGFIGG